MQGVGVSLSIRDAEEVYPKNIPVLKHSIGIVADENYFGLPLILKVRLFIVTIFQQESQRYNRGVKSKWTNASKTDEPALHFMPMYTLAFTR